jgi:DNA primase
MSWRIVIPIENAAGELVAYSGRSIDGSEPKYKVLYDLARAVEEGSNGTVVLVEGFFDCIRVVQAEHVCVALMGCALSADQEEQLAARFRRGVVMLDGDEAGRRAATEIAGRLAHRVCVRVVDVPDGKQPDQLSIQVVQELLAKV